MHMQSAFSLSSGELKEWRKCKSPCMTRVTEVETPKDPENSYGARVLQNWSYSRFLLSAGKGWLRHESRDLFPSNWTSSSVVFSKCLWHLSITKSHLTHGSAFALIFFGSAKSEWNWDIVLRRNALVRRCKRSRKGRNTPHKSLSFRFRQVQRERNPVGSRRSETFWRGFVTWIVDYKCLWIACI